MQKGLIEDPNFSKFFEFIGKNNADTFLSKADPSYSDLPEWKNKLVEYIYENEFSKIKGLVISIFKGTNLWAYVYRNLDDVMGNAIEIMIEQINKFDIEKVSGLKDKISGILGREIEGNSDIRVEDFKNSEFKENIISSFLGMLRSYYSLRLKGHVLNTLKKEGKVGSLNKKMGEGDAEVGDIVEDEKQSELMEDASVEKDKEVIKSVIKDFIREMNKSYSSKDFEKFRFYNDIANITADIFGIHDEAGKMGLYRFDSPYQSQDSRDNLRNMGKSISDRGGNSSFVSLVKWAKISDTIQSNINIIIKNSRIYKGESNEYTSKINEIVPIINNKLGELLKKVKNLRLVFGSKNKNDVSESIEKSYAEAEKNIGDDLYSSDLFLSMALESNQIQGYNEAISEYNTLVYKYNNYLGDRYGDIINEKEKESIEELNAWYDGDNTDFKKLDSVISQTKLYNLKVNSSMNSDNPRLYLLYPLHKDQYNHATLNTMFILLQNKIADKLDVKDDIRDSYSLDRYKDLFSNKLDKKEKSSRKKEEISKRREFEFINDISYKPLKELMIGVFNPKGTIPKEIRENFKKSSYLDGIVSSGFDGENIKDIFIDIMMELDDAR